MNRESSLDEYIKAPHDLLGSYLEEALMAVDAYTESLKALVLLSYSGLEYSLKDYVKFKEKEGLEKLEKVKEEIEKRIKVIVNENS